MSQYCMDCGSKVYSTDQICKNCGGDLAAQSFKYIPSKPAIPRSNKSDKDADEVNARDPGYPSKTSFKVEDYEDEKTVPNDENDEITNVKKNELNKKRVVKRLTKNDNQETTDIYKQDIDYNIDINKENKDKGDLE